MTLLASMFLLVFVRVDRLRPEYWLVPVLFIAAELSSGSLEAVGRITMLGLPVRLAPGQPAVGRCSPSVADGLGRAVHDGRGVAFGGYWVP